MGLWSWLKGRAASTPDERREVAITNETFSPTYEVLESDKDRKERQTTGNTFEEDAEERRAAEAREAQVEPDPYGSLENDAPR